MKYYSLIDKVYNKRNLEEAYLTVRANKGAPGVDGQTVDAYGENLEAELDKLHLELKTGEYKPMPVRRVEISKPDGGKRLLGVPTIKDRVVQQALLNIMQPIFDPDFHPSSYGYRPGRSCQQAVAEAERYINQHGFEYVVDMDLSKCFDRLDHELILQGVNRKISDGSVLRLIQQFLEAGVMKDGTYEETNVGSPQGGVISPLIANIYLDYFDQIMKTMGIHIIRYADDSLVFARSQRQAERYKRKAFKILEDELKLVVNREKTQIVSVEEGIPYLGFVIYRRYVTIHSKKIKAFKNNVRKLTPRNHPMNIEAMVKRLNSFLRGWINYFRAANCKSVVRSLMGWTRRRLRMKKMREWKTWKPLHKELRRRGYKGEFKKISMRRWRNSASPLISMALPNSWFDELGLVDLAGYEVGVLHRYFPND
jgi:RNA-directed DNA polymerase